MMSIRIFFEHSDGFSVKIVITYSNSKFLVHICCRFANLAGILPSSLPSSLLSNLPSIIPSFYPEFAKNELIGSGIEPAVDGKDLSDIIIGSYYSFSSWSDVSSLVHYYADPYDGALMFQYDMLDKNEQFLGRFNVIRHTYFRYANEIFNPEILVEQENVDE